MLTTLLSGNMLPRFLFFLMFILDNSLLLVNVLEFSPSALPRRDDPLVSLGQKPEMKLSPSFSSFLGTTRLSSSMKSTSKTSLKSVHFCPFPNATIIIQAATIQVHSHDSPFSSLTALSPPPTNPPSFLQIDPSFRPNLAPSLCFLKPSRPPHHCPKKLNTAVRVSDDLISTHPDLSGFTPCLTVLPTFYAPTFSVFRICHSFPHLCFP